MQKQTAAICLFTCLSARVALPVDLVAIGP